MYKNTVMHYTSEKGNKYLITGGVFTGYGFKNKTHFEKNILAFDSTAEVKFYIEERENGKNHFCDDLTDLTSKKT